ncbi:MAG TPA: hypothetical protein VE907_07055 [Gammaproteobacteria bacterium]|nr:hypothetical protein [Gammaproteobacteria bacterium]
MATTTLLELAAQRVAAAQAEKTAAQDALLTAQNALTSGQNALETGSRAVKAQNDAIAADRAALAAIATPADAAPILVRLRTETIAHRTASGAVVAATVAVAQARVALEQARARLRDADAALAAADADIESVRAAHDKRAAATQSMAESPVADVAVRATGALASPQFAAAKQRVEIDFPAALRDRARDRAATALNRVKRARQTAAGVVELVDAHFAGGRAADRIEAAARVLAEKDAELFDFVARGPSRVVAAEAALARVASTDNPPLTAEEHAAIDDAARKAAREAAATLEGERDTARDAFEKARADYDLEGVAVLATDGPDGVTAALADATTDLAKAKKALDDASDELQDKETDFDAAARQTIKEWAAAVPDSAWRDLVDFDAAAATLDELDGGPGTLVADVAAAETALIEALTEADEEAFVLRALQGTAAADAVAADVAAANVERTGFVALRGDN